MLIQVIQSHEINTPSPGPNPFKVSEDYYNKQVAICKEDTSGYQLLKLFRLGQDHDENNTISLRKTSMNMTNARIEEDKTEDDWSKLDAFLLSPEEPELLQK